MVQIFDPWIGTPSMDETPPIYGWRSPPIGCHIHRFPFDPWMGISAVGVHHILFSYGRKLPQRNPIRVITRTPRMKENISQDTRRNLLLYDTNSGCEAKRVV